MSLMGIDIGTSGCKVVVIGADGNVLCKASAGYSLVSEQPGFYALDAEEVWDRISDCIRSANAETAEVSDPVSSVSFSSQGEAVIPVDENGSAIDKGPISSDMRGKCYLDDFSHDFDRNDLFFKTGQLIDPIHSLFKILWWRDNRPDVFAKASKFVCFDAFACMRLGLEAVTDYSMASRMFLFDYRKKRYDERILSYADLSEDRLPTVIASASLVGILPECVCMQLGFKLGVRVYAGGHDQPCSAFGSGIIDSGVNYSIGTTECLSLVSNMPFESCQLGIPSYPHVCSGRFISLIGSQTGSRVLSWMAEEFAGKDIEDFFQLIRRVDPALKTDVIFLAHMAGSNFYHDPNARAVLSDITFGTSRNEIIKAVFEGITFEQYLGFMTLKNYKIFNEIQKMRIVGGGSTIDNWVQIKADIFQREMVTLSKHDTGAIGAGMLAGIGDGTFSSEAEAVAICVKECRRFEPDCLMQTYYEDKEQKYNNLYRKQL